MEPVCCSMSSSNCCFLTCIQVSQEAGQVAHLFKNFPQFVVIQTVKGFSIVNKVEVDAFWNCFAFSMIQWMLAIWSLIPLSFLSPAWTSGSQWFMYCWSLAWGFWAFLCLRVRWVQLCSSLNILWHCLALGLEWKLTFSSPVATGLHFPNLLAFWVQHFHSIIF